MFKLRVAALCAAVALGALASAPPQARADGPPATQPGGTAAVVPAAPAGPQLDQATLDRLNALEAEVRKLRAEAADPAARAAAVQAAAKESAARTDAVVNAVMKDAESREALGLGVVTARYHDGRLDIASADGTFLLHPFTHFEFRYIYNNRDNAFAPGGGQDTQSGFDLRRMEFGAEGHLFSKDFQYFVLFEADRHNGGLVLESAFVQYHLADTPFSIKAGTFNDPLDHEGQTSGARAVAVERSLTVDLLAAGDAFSKGVSLFYDAGGPVRFELAFTDGIGSANQNFQDFPTNSANWGTAGRVEYKFFGDWGAYGDATALGNKEDLLVAGAGYDYTEAGSSAAFRHVGDVQYETGPVGLYAAYLGRYNKDNPLAGGSDTYDWSVRLQAAYLFDSQWEAFVRYDYIRFGGLPVGADPNVHEAAVGFNRYLHGMQARFTFDAVYLPNGSPFSDDASGVLGNRGGSQFLVRGQFQFFL